MDSGSIDVNLKIREPLPNTVTVIIYATYSTDIHIDIDNKVLSIDFDYDIIIIYRILFGGR